MADRVFFEDLLGAPGFLNDLRRFISTRAEILDWITGAVEQQGTFEVTEELISGGKERGIDSAALTSALRVAEFLYDHSRHEKISSEAAAGELRRIADTLGESLDEAKFRSISALLSPKAKYDQQEAISQALSGGPSRVQTFSLEVDARAVVDPQSGEFLGFVPIVVGKLTVVEALAQAKDVDFRVTEEQLKEIKDLIEQVLITVHVTKSELETKLLN